MLRHKPLLIALSAVAATAALLMYALTRTSLPAQMVQLLGTNIALTFAIGTLILLAAVAVICLVYGFGMEHSMGRSGKMHDLGR